MTLRSLGYRTDLIFAAFDGEIVERGDYRVIRTPANPTYYWGNFLLFNRRPDEGDLEIWCALFARELGVHPGIEHQSFGWDDPGPDPGRVEPFLSEGFRLERASVLTAGEISPLAKAPSEVVVRPLATDDDFTQSVENQVVTREPGFPEEEHRGFRRRQMDRYRAMEAEGRGCWFGAFLGERLVADLGIFHDGVVGRFQSVQTHPDFRRRGIAAKLIAGSTAHAREHFGLDTLVIVSEAGSAAQRLYESLGFRVTENQTGLCRWPERIRDGIEG